MYYYNIIVIVYVYLCLVFKCSKTLWGAPGLMVGVIHALRTLSRLPLVLGITCWTLQGCVQIIAPCIHVGASNADHPILFPPLCRQAISRTQLWRNTRVAHTWLYLSPGPGLFELPSQCFDLYPIFLHAPDLKSALEHHSLCCNQKSIIV